MNLLQDLITTLQDLVAQVPELLQPFIVMLAGAIPAIEGDAAAVIGIIAGLSPIVAAIAAAVGNFLTVLVIVLLTSRARTAVVNRAGARVGATVGGREQSSGAESDASDPAVEAMEPARPESKRREKGRQRFNKWFVRFGVPGASILGPIALPTHVTSAILVAGGSPRGWVLIWQAVAIAVWTTVATVSAWLALMLVFWI
ncbi:MAG TPA: small multidrug efflux protein [Microbacterium sp.]|nr:small multidrug efflux protein [Microbacterium sp.]